MYAMHICELYSQRVYCIQSISNWYLQRLYKKSLTLYTGTTKTILLFSCLRINSISAHIACTYILCIFIVFACEGGWVCVCIFQFTWNPWKIRKRKDIFVMIHPFTRLPLHLIYLLMCKSTLCLSSLPPCMHFYAFHSNKLTCEIICKRKKKSQQIRNVDGLSKLLHQFSLAQPI